MNQDENSDIELQARRRLLKAAVYVPPAVLGVLTVGSSPAQAITIGGLNYPVSTLATACGPCQKVVTAQGGINAQNLQNWSLDCIKEQCTGGSCVNCEWFVNNAALYGKTTADKCEKALDAGCSKPAACAGVNCTKKIKNGRVKIDRKTGLPEWTCN